MAQDTYASARVVNIILGLWLFISAFIWVHTSAQMNNAWIVGVLAMAFAIIALRVPEVRYLNTVLGVWLFISVWALPTENRSTMWNHIIIGIAMFLASLSPGYARDRTRPITRP
ncbi:MAG: SPW repeat protein [Minicystis sp.]